MSISPGKRRAILERDGGRCTECRRRPRFDREVLEVHHVIWKVDGGSDARENLVTVCHPCHRRLHGAA